MSIPSQLQQLFTEGVTDVLVSGPRSAQIDRGSGLERVEVDFGSAEQLRKLAIELAIQAGSRVDIAKPIADFSAGNIRCQVVLPFGVSSQTLISLRRHPSEQVTLEHLIEANMLSRAESVFLEAALARKQTILILGATGTGKTTLLSALIFAARQRTICIEQTPELNPRFPAVGLVERDANQEGLGRIDSIDLLSHALRMRPDRLVIGEVRGREFGALLLAINNGHSAMATLHCESLEALPRRLGVLSQLSGLEQSLAIELLRSVDLVVQLSSVGLRKIQSLARLELKHANLVAVPLEV